MIKEVMHLNKSLRHEFDGWHLFKAVQVELDSGGKVVLQPVLPAKFPPPVIFHKSSFVKFVTIRL